MKPGQQLGPTGSSSPSARAGWASDDPPSAAALEPITRGSHTFDWPHVSPDGRQIVFRGRNGHEDLFLVRTDGTGLRRLTSDHHFDRRPRWSPDGRRILFYLTRGGHDDVWTVAPDGRNEGVLVFDLEAREYRVLHDTARWPVWLPDGRRVLAFEGDALWMLDAESGKTREVLRSPPGTMVNSGTLTARGDSLYLAIASEEADLWVARLE